MALRQAEKLQLEFINDTAKMLGELNIEEAVIIEKTKEKVSELEQSANCKLVLNQENGVYQFNVIDLRADYVRTRFNTEQTMLSLRAKILGLPIDVKIKKDDDVFSNKEVAKSLRELADVVAAMPLEMVSHGQDDWSRTLGEMPKSVQDLQSEMPAQNDDVESETVQATETVVEAPMVTATDEIATATQEQDAPVEDVLSTPAELPGEAPVSLPGESAVPETAAPKSDDVPSSNEQSLI